MSTCILTTYYNPTASKIFLNNFNIFLEYIHNLNLSEHLYVCEISNNKETELKNIQNHYFVNSNTILWHKETAINFLLKKIPEKYTKVIVMDNDILIDNLNWFRETEELLNDYIVVQPYEYIKYIGPENYIIDTIESSILSNNKHYISNPGLCVAYKKEYLDSVGGLFDLDIVGGGDTINMIPFMSNENITLNIFDRVCLDHRIYILDYIRRCKDYISTTKLNHATYLSGSVATHLYHGLKINRHYGDRYNLIKDINFIDFFRKNNFGFYDILDKDYCLLKQQEIKNFFYSRQNTIDSSKPLIINTNKYSVDNNILWLSSTNLLTFQNIDYIEIVFGLTKQLKYIQMIMNNKLIEFNFENNFLY